MMVEDRTRILNMLKDDKISVEEAEELLNALDKGKPAESLQTSNIPKKSYKYLRVLVEGSGSNKEKVNVKIPLGLIRAGCKMGSIIPRNAKEKLDLKFNEKGINFSFDELNPENIDDLLQALGEMSIDIEDDEEKVRIFCE